MTSHNSPEIRLCHLYKRNTFEGYGFNLYKKTKEELHIIGSLESGSPGLDGGLRENDILIEVNGVNVEKIKHQDVVDKIREHHLEVSLLVIDKKTNSKRKKKNMKISSSNPNVVLLYSEKMNPINEAEILEVKNNLKNISESKTVNEAETAVNEDVVDDVDANNEENLKNVSASIDAEDKDDADTDTQNNGDFDFPDNNSLLNETVEELMEKRREEAISSDSKNEKQEEEEVNSVEVFADEAEEEILDEELMECSDTETSFKTASSTASISSNDKSYPSDDSGPRGTPSPGSDENELLSLHLPGSVKEMKELIVQRKKKDSRIDNKFDLWQKHSIIQAL